MSGLWAAAFLVPLVVALGLATVGLTPDRIAEPARSALTRAAPLALVPAGVLGVVAADGDQWRLPWLLVGTSFRMDDTGRALLIMAVAIYASALLMVTRSVGHRHAALSGLLLLCFVGNVGAFIAADVVTLYLCFTVMSLVGYALVIHDRSQQARRAGRIYLVLAVLGEAAVLVAAMLVVQTGGRDLTETAQYVAAAPSSGVIVALLWVGFGIKIGTVPLHVWLPLAHPAAPTPASAVLSGAMITAGLVGWLRMLPLGELAMPGWGLVLLITGLFGAFAAVALGVMQAETKTVLAYSSISQMGLLSALVGSALLEPSLAPAVIAAAVLYAVHHGLIKAGLFLGVGVWQRHGGGRLRWLVVAGLALAGWSLVGLPLSSGYLAKYAAKEAVGEVALGAVPIATVLALVGTGSAVLLARAAWLLMHKDTQDHRADVAVVGWLALIAGSPVLVWWIGTPAGEVSLPGWFDPSVWWAQSWPVLIGVAAAALGLRVSAAEVLPAWLGHPDGRTVPPGDLVVLEEGAASRVQSQGRAMSRWIRSARRAATDAVAGLPAATALVTRAEGGLSGWRSLGAALLGMLTISMALAWWGG